MEHTEGDKTNLDNFLPKSLALKNLDVYIYRDSEKYPQFSITMTIRTPVQYILQSHTLIGHTWRKHTQIPTDTL